MSGSRIPHEAPPSYTEATGSSAPPTSNPTSSHLEVPGASSSSNSRIPDEYRRSMEDEGRPLPKGWVRTFDPDSTHQFYVDTTRDPPRSIWNHPYDDDEYLSSLPSAERERLEQENMTSYLGGAKRDPSHEDYIHAHSDVSDDDHQHAPTGSAATSNSAGTAELPPRPDGGKDKGKGNDNRSFGRKLKDKVTGTTHEERQRTRAQREAEERKMYERHMQLRKAMVKAMQTGEPQLIGKDKDGNDLYLTPPKQSGYSSMGGRNYYNPYGGGLYAAPGMYGGGMGMGMPLAAGLGGGLLAGGLLGGALF
ncbi:hypothetical protein EJ05DRAFT_462532 [Pseudovirgaria hyperparasitica]|uniref:WW domain-containing protein n=1 Tax=Pseudovirgaria hyperparasitica TaxID=470096 RepID=A0A6A6WD16_9PEZI|nr:uncharacterized protein EJ05DRAFT_462532 [Pseudovirgaria hyperparasitica]KAF2760465.1 hypothetical protein EJ05DRAFT_462532 [Pseudovirgaria hyperparasitica]